MNEPTFWEKVLAFVLVVAGTGAFLWLTTTMVKAGFGLLGSCR